jgi:hypothetical protein
MRKGRFSEEEIIRHPGRRVVPPSTGSPTHVLYLGGRNTATWGHRRPKAKDARGRKPQAEERCFAEAMLTRPGDAVRGSRKELRTPSSREWW